MTTPINPFDPIVAYGIASEKTLTATPLEGSTVMALSNSSDIIAIGDPVWVRSADETVLQYRGIVTASSTTQITCQISLQDAVGASATAWKPTNFVRFFGELRDTQRPVRNTGITTVQTMSGTVFQYQAADFQDSVSLNVWDHNMAKNATLYQDWLDFLETRGPLAFNLGYYSLTRRRGETPKAHVREGEHEGRVINVFTNALSETFFILDRALYVES